MLVRLSYRNPVVSSSAFTTNSRCRETGVAERCDLLFASNFLCMSDVELTIMVLTRSSQRQSIHIFASYTPLELKRKELGQYSKEQRFHRSTLLHYP